MDDPRATAQQKFASPRRWSGLDLLARCATDPPLAIATLLDAARPLGAGARIVELGFGDGWLIDEMAQAFPDGALVGLDQSPAYVRRAGARFGSRVTIIRGDMEALPFAGGSLDVIVTCWTLYFMADIDAALGGMRRCLRRGGRLIAATVAPDHMQEHEDLLAEAVREALDRERPPDVGARFDLASGEAYMRRAFNSVEMRTWSGELMVPDIETALELFDAYPPVDVISEEGPGVRAAYMRLASERLARDGAIRVRRHDGAFVATI